MKKYSILLIMFISLFFVFNKNVFAEEKYSCSYNVQYAEGGYFNIKASANTDGTYEVFYEEEADMWKPTSGYKIGGIMRYSTGGKYVSNGISMFDLGDLSNKIFEKAISSSKLTTDCPVINVYFDNSSMYNFYFSDTSSDTYLYNIEGKLSGSKDDSLIVIKENTSCPYTLSTKEITDLENLTVYSSFRMKSDGTKLICASSTKKNLNSSCTNYNTGDYSTTIRISGEVYILDINSKDLLAIFSQTSAQKKQNVFTCPSAMYLVYTSVTQGTLLLTTDKAVAEDYNKGIINGNATASADENVTEPKSDDLYTNCPLGINVTKDIYGLLKILKITIPILVIGLTIIEGVKAVAKGEIAGEEKKLAIRFVKRLIIAVILFFLPVLVNQIMIMANIWDENGTCDFSGEIKYNNPNNSSTTTSTTIPTTQDDYRAKDCDGYYDANLGGCIKKSDITCSIFSGNKAKCKNRSKEYGLSCDYNDMNFKCTESTTVTEPADKNNNVISDISKFPKESLDCWMYGYDNCIGHDTCGWTGENSTFGTCHSKVEVSPSIVAGVCALATEREQCNSLDSYCEWLGYRCASYTE